MSAFDTVVVGAGIAGVTAANLLSQAGQRVVVVEARDRVGGRLWTDRSAGFCVDLGASWIHGVDGNPLTDLVEAFDIDTVEFTVGAFQPDSRPIANYSPSFELLDSVAAQRWADDVHVVDEELERVIASSDNGQSYAAVAAQALATRDWDTERMQRVWEFYRHRTEEQCGAHISEVAAHGLDEDVIFGDEVVFPGGYDQLVLTLARGLDIRLNQVVTSVAWSTEGARVDTATASFEARQVVVTVPLGVLKSEAIQFVPELPPEVAGPIERLGMGVFVKVFLQFPQRFWPGNVYAIRQQGAAGDVWHSWYDVSGSSGQPMLLAFAGGPRGREVEGMTDEQVVASTLASLRQIYGDSVPGPVNHWVTRWGADPYSLGSYSHVAVGASHEDHDAMATPVGGVVHLAGEATWSTDPATVNGALLSGHRAAERVLGRPIDLGELHQHVPDS
ncbi:flavin monoamine oxidase family protein [Mycolicibacterium nivoides]|uniref:flavin monoamine oxidase family protein n=1 Tax=Mycolicibacterium nivoides TaxID=2487344 RepID=UPI0008C20999|nr:NAD(P)/FAD-dependent oxidoreductase [Mycolicibacterium nivoides]MBN3512086.1 FAD-dependent oxidoreductase [Mycolicibacterium septicum]SEP63192.1 Monoamine oxidase [Mycobacterium sp. 88mf]SFF07356.1 Monoamine oxidase [Mycobacterium sp. 455mf]